MSLVISAASTSRKTRPNQRKEKPTQQPEIAQPRKPEPTIPIRDFEAAQSALLHTLSALHAEQEARAKEKQAQYEPWYAPSVLVQFGLLVVGFFYTCFARWQWVAIKEQAEIANKALVETRRAADAAKDAAEASTASARTADAGPPCPA